MSVSDDPQQSCETTLSNRAYSVTVTADGAGRSVYRDVAVNRWRDDLTTQRWGQFFYIRDIAAGAVWSAGIMPTLAESQRYDVTLDKRIAVFRRIDHDIAASMEVAVAPDSPVEIRRITLLNQSGRARHLDVTSYMEVVIAPEAGDLAHPAFSNLFVQTESIPALRALLCARRPRAETDKPLWLFHAVAAGSTGIIGRHEFETDRARFLGRGKTILNPAAIESGGPLSNTSGAVLDPIVSIRTAVKLAPGGTADIVFVTGVGKNRREAYGLLSRHRKQAVWSGILNRSAAGVAANAILREPPKRYVPPDAVAETGRMDRDPRRHNQLKAFNGFGGFTPDGREYVIVLDRGKMTPVPWVNVISNPAFGFQVSESGSGYTWSRNSRENKLTPWSNDPVSDPPGEAIYVKDERSGEIWTPTPLPVAGRAPCVIRHGQGYSRFEMKVAGIEHDLCQFVPVDMPVKISRIRLTNRTRFPRTLSVTYYAEWVLGVSRPLTHKQLRTGADAESGLLYAVNASNGVFSNHVAFLDCPAKKHYSWTADRSEFLGAAGDPARPAGLCGARLSGRAGDGVDPAAVIRVAITLLPGQTRELSFLLGEARTRAHARAISRALTSPVQVDRALKVARDEWDKKLGAVTVKTPDVHFDLLVNRWLLYQTLSCRIWSRSAFYQSGGAFGFRDQLQDVRALVYADDKLVRDHIVRAAGRQFIEGDVQHWWHTPSGMGPRTRCSDDLVWLPWVTADYITSTRDDAILDRRIPYLKGKSLRPGEQELCDIPDVSRQVGTLYDHCVKALDRAVLSCGRHGLPLMGSCDWNDGMNRVGHRGKGESVWMGWFLIDALNRFVPHCDAKRDVSRARRYRETARRLSDSIEKYAWDGRWYRRAFNDDGLPLGSAKNDECRIDSLAQTWAVLSGAGREDRIPVAMRNLERFLVKYFPGLILLLTPPFDKSRVNPGYIKGYLPGVRENGGQYTHAATWVVLACARMGDGDKAMNWFQLLNPIRHALTADQVERYKVEPYVMAADVYGVDPHKGRGGWTWYTGSSGWMYRIAIESLLGLKRNGPTFTIDPCIPRNWPRFAVSYSVGRAVFDITVENPRRVSRGVKRITLDGRDLKSKYIPAKEDRQKHTVRVVMG